MYWTVWCPFTVQWVPHNPSSGFNFPYSVFSRLPTSCVGPPPPPLPTPCVQTVHYFDAANVTCRGVVDYMSDGVKRACHPELGVGNLTGAVQVLSGCTVLLRPLHFPLFSSSTW